MPQDNKCISFVNPKGGTGKTTSCVSIAGYLAKEGKKVLIVDFDPRANATLGLGIDPGTLKKSIYDAVLSYCGYRPMSIKSIIRETKIPNLYIAPSEPDLSVAEVLMQKRTRKSFILKRMLEEVKPDFDYILIDLPSSTGQLMFNGLCASDHVITSLEPGVFSLDSFERLKNIFDDIRDLARCSIDKVTIILTRYEKPDLLSSILRRQNSSQEVEMKLKQNNRDIFIVPESRQIYEAQKQGLPVSHYAPGSAVGKAYKKIAKYIIVNVK